MKLGSFPKLASKLYAEEELLYIILFHFIRLKLRTILSQRVLPAVLTTTEKL